jgi:hypothetical protein
MGFASSVLSELLCRDERQPQSQQLCDQRGDGDHHRHLCQTAGYVDSGGVPRRTVARPSQCSEASLLAPGPTALPFLELTIKFWHKI